jgi:hypothetical protein
VTSASRSEKSILAAVLALTLPGNDLPGQEQPKIAVEVKTVSVLSTVRDRRGKIVPNLSKDDFLLDEDGRPQVINYFAREKNLPLRLGLLVDTSLSAGARSIRNAEPAMLSSTTSGADKDVAFVCSCWLGTAVPPGPQTGARRGMQAKLD